jgi:glycosyltransferase involved in cell wall biosynthesis
MKIAICGTRGIPARYGGFETFAEELSTRLVERGHSVRVYGRPHVVESSGKTYRGVELCLLPAVRQKYLETPLHTLLCFLHNLVKPVDLLLVCNGANSPFLWIPRLTGTPCIVNVDGIERLRGKWNRLGKLWYRLGEFCSVLFASVVVSDAEVIRQYYKETYRRNSTVIPYGYRQGEIERVLQKTGLCRRSDINSTEAVGNGSVGAGVASDGLTAESISAKSLAGKSASYIETATTPTQFSEAEQALFAELGVEPGKYLLYVSRLEPENNAHVVIEAYQKAGEAIQQYPLVIVGDAPYAKEYIAGLHKMAGPRVIFAGFRFGEPYVTLQLGARLYIQATEVGGTHPALVESMGYGNCIIVNGTPENVEVIGDAGVIYPKNDVSVLARELSSLVCDEYRLTALRRRAFLRAEERYLWETIVTSYEELFRSQIGRGS